MRTNSSPAARFTFKKEERLSRKKLIDELFKDGSSFYLPPFKVICLERHAEDVPAVRVLITVSTRNFPKAVDRNRIKRLTREAYRLNKQILYETLTRRGINLLLAFIYTGKKIESFERIREKMISILERLSENNESVEKNSG